MPWRSVRWLPCPTCPWYCVKQTRCPLFSRWEIPTSEIKNPQNINHTESSLNKSLRLEGTIRSLQPQNLDNTGHLENSTIVVCLTFIMPASTSLPLPFTQEDDYFLWFQINQALSFTCQNWRNWCVGGSFQSQSCLSPLLGVVAGLWRMVRWIDFAIFLLDQKFTEKNWNGDMIRQRKWFRYQNKVWPQNWYTDPNARVSKNVSTKIVSTKIVNVNQRKWDLGFGKQKAASI